MTTLLYLRDAYLKESTATIQSINKKGSITEIVLNTTIFYPEGGGQPSDKGIITAKEGKAHVKHVRMKGDDIIHECTIEGKIYPDDSVQLAINWQLRYSNMRVHSAGHIVHEAVMKVFPQLAPVKGEHGNHPYIEYIGSIPETEKSLIQEETDALVSGNLSLTTEFVTYEELKNRVSFIPEHLPKHKPLRILTIDGFQPIPDGGTQVKKTSEVGTITITEIENNDDHVKVYYAVPVTEEKVQTPVDQENTLNSSQLMGSLIALEQEAKIVIDQSTKEKDLLTLELLGAKSEFAKLSRQIQFVSKEERSRIGALINQVKQSIEEKIETRHSTSPFAKALGDTAANFDITLPGIQPPHGHLHIVTQAISEITRIFERIGFTRVRYPEADWDYYAFEALNMPPDHPARDEWETFLITPPWKGNHKDDRFKTIVLTPHTSNGQVREMEKGNVPIRMINIAKCYRRQSDVSHTEMFHQFEGLYVDQNVSIAHLKGVIEYFVKNFYGPKRTIRLRPFHFQFTEPSFEIDVTCGICLGKGCRLCKEGWLELGGAGMVHPNVLNYGKIDTTTYNGFAFGWGVERTFMMKSGTKIDDIRTLYGNDVRFLEQF